MSQMHVNELSPVEIQSRDISSQRSEGMVSLQRRDFTSTSWESLDETETSPEVGRNEDFVLALFGDVAYAKEEVRNRLLPKRFFLEHLRHEKLRADRSRSLLSLVVIRLDRGLASNRKRFRSFLTSLHNSIRETDILGYLGQDVIGLILPDTNKESEGRVVKHIVEAGESLILSVTTHTYPHELFESLKAEYGDADKVSPLISHEIDEEYRIPPVLKRGLDILGALVALVVFSPVFVITAIAIKLTSPGPVIFKQVRLGRHGVPFVMYKFRSMRTGVDDNIHREYVENLIKGNVEELNQRDSSKPLYKMASDNRITSVGRLIRKWSVDEFPQFFNLLKGDMSLVGPRPPLLYEAEKYEPWHLRRLYEAKPGITGLWQVEGRSETTFDEMVRLDLEYSRHCSLRLDLQILLKTFAVVLLGRGAV